MKSVIVFGAIGLGFVLLVASGLWTSMFPATSSWTDEKAQRSSEVKARLSDLGPIVTGASRSMHRGPDPATLKAEFEALKKENELLNAEYQSAADRPHTISKILKWTGISLAVIGVIGWYAVNQSR